MITTRTRILSILAIVALLASMVACLVLPASAAASDQSDAWKYVLLSIQDYATVAPETTALFKAVSKSTDGTTDDGKTWADVKASAIAEIAPKIANGEANAFWNDFAWDGDAVTTRFPRFRYHEEFEAAGYTGKDWTIDTAADWLLMIEESKYDATNNPTPKTFEGAVFHVIKNINFNNEVMEPLNPGADGDSFIYCQENATTYPFNGTIQGHGYAFYNIKVEATCAGSNKNASFGMIGKLGPDARINNFGVDSGSITAKGSAKNLYVSTFGDPVTKKAGVRLNKVWSGATLSTGNCSATTTSASGILALGRDSTVEINGAYFFGSLTADTKTAGLFIDIKNGEDVYNSLSDAATATAAIYLAAATSPGNAINNYSVGCPTFSEASPSALVMTGSGTAASAAEGAWKINNSTAVSDIDAVYYTWTKDAEGNDAIRPTGTVDNMIVKVSVSGSVETDLYLNKGTLTKTELVAKLGLPETAITSLTVNGAEAGDEIAISGDTAINVTAAGAELLAVALEKYAALDAKYLTDNAATALIAFREAAAAAGEDLGKIQAVLDSEETMAAALETYSTYPMAEGKEIPGYALVETYEAYNTAKVWAIGTTADWLKMVDDSKITKKSQSFTGYQFHVLNDIDFDATPDDDTSNVGIPMAPLCFGEGGNDAVTAAFQGKIDGHNHAFKNINVSAEGSSGTSMIGLIGKLSKLATIENFGVDSGTIKATGPAKAYVATFGEVLHTEDKSLTGTATLNNIWSGADIIAETEGSNVALGLLGYTDGPVNVNGFYFFGTLSATKSYDVFYRLRRSPSFYNVLSAPTVIGETAHAGMHGVHSAPDGFTVVNNFSTLSDAPDAGTTGTVTNSGKVASALEGAWKINSNPTENPVYFTITEDGIRPIGTADNMIVKVTLSGTKSGELYVNKNSTATVAAIAAALGVSADKVLTINGADAADVAITGDTTLEIGLYACDHTANTNTEYVWDGANGHKILCSECGEAAAEGTCGGTWAAGEVDLTNGTSKHTKTCPDCKHDYEVACNGNLVADTTDCTNDSKYVFECGVHNAEYVIAGSGHADHDFSEAEWTPAEGAAGTKQSKTCAHCSTKIYQIIGGAEAAGVELKADAAGNIVLTLPIALKSAKLTFTVPAGYTVTNVEGAAADAGFYTVANTAAGATVTITVDSALSAIGGVLEVAVTDAIAEDDTAVTDAIAQATIGFTAKEGDANGDDAVNLADALDVLYVVTSTKNVSTINAYNANVFLANDEDKDALILNVNDVYAIVEAWLLDVAF